MMSTEDKITKAKIRVMSEHPFFSYLLLQSKIKQLDNMPMPTIGVDAVGNIYYDKGFVDNTQLRELIGSLIHEVMHTALMHLIRVGSRDKTLWNIATDVVINAILKQNGVSLPEGSIVANYKDETEVFGYVIKDCSKKTAEEVYDELLSQKDVVKQIKEQYSGVDVHIFGKGTPQGDNKDEESKSKNNKQTATGYELSDEEKKELERKIKQMVAEAATNAKNRGKVPSGMERIIGELLEPKISWKALLNRYVISTFPSDTTWDRPHKKSISTGVYLPNVVRETVDVTVAVDVSGSISDSEYREFISEMVGIAKSFKQVNMNVLFWDTEVGKDLEVYNGNIEKIKRAKVRGYGGTDFSCVKKYLEEKHKRPRVVVCFSDGWIESNPQTPNVDTLIWVITSDGTTNVVKKTGKGIVIKMENEK